MGFYELEGGVKGGGWIAIGLYIAICQHFFDKYHNNEPLSAAVWDAVCDDVGKNEVWKTDRIF